MMKMQYQHLNTYNHWDNSKTDDPHKSINFTLLNMTSADVFMEKQTKCIFSMYFFNTNLHNESETNDVRVQ